MAHIPQVRNNLDWVRAISGGWVPPGIAVTPSPETTYISQAELSRHCTFDDAWVAIRGRVYNVTPYLTVHPGGEAQLMRVAGRDGTVMFDALHRWVTPETTLGPCWVGMLGEKPSADVKTADLLPPPLLVDTASPHNAIDLCNINVSCVKLSLEESSFYGHVVTCSVVDAPTRRPLFGPWMGAAVVMTTKQPKNVQDIVNNQPRTAYLMSEPYGAELTFFLPRASEVVPGDALWMTGPLAPINTAKIAEISETIANATNTNGMKTPSGGDSAMASLVGADFRHMLARGGPVPAPWSKFTPTQQQLCTRGILSIDEENKSVVWPGGVVRLPSVVIVAHGLQGLAAVLPALLSSPDGSVGISDDSDEITTWYERICLLYVSKSKRVSDLEEHVVRRVHMALQRGGATRMCVVVSPDASVPTTLPDDIKPVVMTISDISAVDAAAKAEVMDPPVHNSLCVLVGSKPDVVACDNSLRRLYYPSTQMAYIALY